MSTYLTLDDVLHIVDRLGFQVRDAGLLASAVARPATSVFGADAYATDELKAAALLESLSRNHPLTDGNKRLAWAVTVTFLWINGLRHTFDTDTAFDLVMGVATGALDINEAAVAIAAHTQAR